MSAIQDLHDIEIGGGLAWPEEGKILVYLGCPLDPPPRMRMYGEALVSSFADAEDWLRKKAEEFDAPLTPRVGLARSRSCSAFLNLAFQALSTGYMTALLGRR